MHTSYNQNLVGRVKRAGAIRTVKPDPTGLSNDRVYPRPLFSLQNLRPASSFPIERGRSRRITKP